MQEAAVVAPLLKLYHAPSDWTWIIGCDDIAWQTIIVHTGMQNLSGRVVGVTDHDAHTTYIRGNDILHPFSLAADYLPRHIIAHELGHITADTGDEEKRGPGMNRGLFLLVFSLDSFGIACHTRTSPNSKVERQSNDETHVSSNCCHDHRGRFPNRSRRYRLFQLWTGPNIQRGSLRHWNDSGSEPVNRQPIHPH
jgi:hypothetical protein